MRRRVILWTVALVALFAFRLLYGLSRELFFEDETQIYLNGLRYYATGVWPYFGPDVVWTKSQIPGALQGLLVGVPLKILPIPEAPYILINLLSMGGLAAFAWYVTARLPAMPRWLVWGWLMTLPWTLEYGTHIINPSYLLAPATVFFIGFFEAVPAFRLGKLREWVAFVLMGAAVGFVLQIHMSWPLLVAYVAFAWLSGRKDGAAALAINAVAFVAGFLIFAVFLLPTFAVYGMNAGLGGTGRNLQPHWINPWIAVTTLARLFSFASLEIWRYMATDDGKRYIFLLRHLWIVPLAFVCWFASLWQPIWMLREWFRTRSPFPEWWPLKWLVVGSVLLVYASYWLVLEPAQAHAFWVIAPVGFMFAAYCWTFVDSPRWRRIAAGLLAVNIVFHIGQGFVQAPENSIFHDRQVIATAVRLKEPEMFGHRRAFAVDGGPPTLQEPSRPHDSRQDMQLSNSQLSMGPGGVALWTITLRNANSRVAFRDVLYRTHYRDEQGKVVVERNDRIPEMFQPGDIEHLEVNDGLIQQKFATASIEVLDAEALLPLPE